MKGTVSPDDPALTAYWQWRTPRTDTLAFEITGEIDVHHEGESYRAAVRTWFDPTTGEALLPQRLFANGSCGLYAMGGIVESDTFTTRFLEQQYPTRTGMKYNVPHLIYHRLKQQLTFDDAFSYRVTATQEVRVPCRNVRGARLPLREAPRA